MSSVIIVYGSTTGNTESVAEMAEKVFSGKGHDVELKDVSEITPADTKGYELLVMGCSTWGEDEIELQDDFLPFFENLQKADLSGRKVAVFGCGDSSYTYFCGAVDEIADKAEELGAKIVSERLKIDGEPDDAEDEIIKWAEETADF